MKMFRFVWILATAILVVFASIAAAQTAQQVAAVPDVTGMKATEAQRMLVQQGWKAGMEYRTVADPKQDGAVLATRPPAGARVSKQQVLILVAGKLTDQTRVPNVTGMPLAEAQKALVANKLNAGVIRENTADPGKNQIVLKQQIAPGTAASPGSTVPIVVGVHTAPAQVKVPYVTGKPLAEAQKILVDNKLNAQVTRQPVTEPQRNGVVIGQKIAVGTPLAPGSMVPVVVGQYTPPAQVKVPSVTGKPIAEAQRILAENKLNAQVSHQPVAEPQRNGVVIGQKIAVGTPLAPGSMVPVVVGQYTPPARVNVPNVTGKPLAEAQRILAENKLNAVVTQEAVRDPAKKGIIVKQLAAPGTALSPGSQVPIVVGRYEEPAKVPNVVGMHWGQANSTLAQAKLAPNVVFRSTADPKKSNIVLEQSIRAGSDVSPGTKVDLAVGRYRTAAEMAREIQERQQSNANNPIPPDSVK